MSPAAKPLNLQNPSSEMDVCVIAGEASADLHAAGLLREFKKLEPNSRFFGCGGDRMAAEGCQNLFHVRDISFLGIAEVIQHLPFIRRMMRTLLDQCQQQKPQAIVLVDYPGFNLRFAARLKKIGSLKDTPILYYISPQVWAWHASRVPHIARLVDRMAVIFDFEVPIYERVGLRTDFVGHPLLEVAQPTLSEEEFRRELSVSRDAPLLALLPGSRRQEVGKLFGLFLETFGLLKKQLPDLVAVVGCSPALDVSEYRQILQASAADAKAVRLLSGKSYDILAYCTAVLTASGTVTLEAAIMGTPQVMAYRVAPLTYWLGRVLVRIPNIALVNVVAGKRIIPEFIQHDAQPHRLAAALLPLLINPERGQEMKSELALVKSKLGRPGASRRTAEILHSLIQEHRASCRG